MNFMNRELSLVAFFVMYFCMEDRSAQDYPFRRGRPAGGEESGRFSPSDDTGRKDRLVGRLSGFYLLSLRNDWVYLLSNWRTDLWGLASWGLFGKGDNLSSALSLAAHGIGNLAAG